MSNNAEQIIKAKAKLTHTYVNTKLPRQAKDLGLQFFKSRFRAQGWYDQSFQPWPRRKKKDKRRPGRALMIDRGRLRNSLRASISGSKITFGTDVPYSKIHNEGGTIHHPGGERILAHKRITRGKRKGRVLFAKNNSNATFSQKAKVGPYTIKMPKRQFMGPSAHLDKVIKRKIELEIRKIFK